MTQSQARHDASALRGRENTRAKLIDAAIEVFARQGMTGASVDDLVSAAGFTRGAFYSNFSSKQELFFAAHDVVSERVLASVRRTLEECQGSALDENLLPALFDKIRPVGRLWYLLRAEAIGAALRSEEDRQRFEQSRRRLRGGLRTLLEEQYALLGISPVMDLDVFAETLAGLYMSLLLQENLDGADTSVIMERGLPALFFGVSDVWDGVSLPRG